MQATTATTAATTATASAKAWPVLGGAALVASACYVAIEDPSADGALLPRCPFHVVTGLWCPGCGLTRATHQLIHGDVAGAMSSNALVAVALGALVVGWISWTSVVWRGRPLAVTRRLTTPVVVALASAALAFGVLRNIPWAPVRTLAP